ncbi:hypothetical protein J8F10_21605 [Gemmata sp. G18]|uniref:Uncharacterized protein n=1 Tax=Gemmata palustris TaxID=2822762 RepID=A0ABS5BVY1_9BACT|nr:hypothetical protein [Gemmata palustris]MBP3957858.1 hypothetical protein [Gemmata palustris]
MDLLLKLRCEEYLPFTRQVVLVDACANIVARAGEPALVPTEQWAKGEVVAGQLQYTLCAASDGQFAIPYEEHRHGGFSRELFDALEAAPAIFPPEMDELYLTLATRFDTLVRAGKTKQTPTRIYHRDWGGTENDYSPRDPRQTLEEAMAAYKRTIDVAWRGGRDESGNPLCDEHGRPRGKWIEVETHPDFRDDS